MARPRTELQKDLRTIAPKAYYRRPSDNKMEYPCFLYRMSPPQVLRADNRLYNLYPCYNVIYISRTPSDTIVRTMLEKFKYCSFDREYESDELYHYSFTLYY